MFMYSHIYRETFKRQTTKVFGDKHQKRENSKTNKKSPELCEHICNNTNRSLEDKKKQTNLSIDLKPSNTFLFGTNTDTNQNNPCFFFNQAKQHLKKKSRTGIDFVS